MYFKISWDEDFDTLMMYLWSKYGKKLFTLDGIGEQLDLNKFSQNFFNNPHTTADVSVDANANVVAKTGIEYNFEMPKPLKRYNSYFLLWKELRKAYGLEYANKVIESQLTGDIYINDFTDVAAPYSYAPGTTLLIRHVNCPDEVLCTSMEELFLRYYAHVHRYPDREVIDLSNKNLEIYEDNRWVRLRAVLRHLNRRLMVRIETKRGNVCSVTDDHPVILEDGTEIPAGKVLRGMRLKEGAQFIPTLRSDGIDADKAYIIGAMVGDGSLSSNGLVFHQKNVKASPILERITKVYGAYSAATEGKVRFGNIIDSAWYRLNTGSASVSRRFPPDFLTWNRTALYNLLAGVIDTDGTINKHSGVVDIRVISITLIQQVAQLATLLGFTRVRTSLAYNYQAHDKGRSFYQKQPLYRISFAVPVDSPIISISEKLTKHTEYLKRVRKKDGRFETNEVLKTDNYFYEGYVYDVTTESGCFYSNGLIVHNCFNYSTYDIALNGLNGISKRLNVEAPKSLSTFLRQVEQFMVVAANSTLGATGFADLLIVASLFVKKIQDTGNDGHVHISDVETYAREKLTEFIYTVNWEFRGNQSPFSNVSLYDDTFLDSLCPDYGADKETVKILQRIYVEVMNAEMRRTPLTFPVTTACFAIDDHMVIQDKAFLRFIAEANREFGFINLYNGSTATLSSCCRLRSERKNEYFNSFGAGSTKIGSLGVVTVNLPRAAIKAKGSVLEFYTIVKDLFEMAQRINASKRRLVLKRIELGAAPLYSHGYMELKKQYSTFGIVGVNEAVQLLGDDILTDKGQEIVEWLLRFISSWIDKAEKEEQSPHNCEQVPAESSAVKLAQKDAMLGYNTGVPLYSNQFIPLITKADMYDRLRLQGMFDSKLSGGAIAHINVGERIDNPETMIALMEYAAKVGVVYWAINYRLNCCKNKHTWVGTEICPSCGETWDTQITRVVGFFTTVKNWNPVRREHDWPNRQFYSGQEMEKRDEVH